MLVLRNGLVHQRVVLSWAAISVHERMERFRLWVL